MVVEVLLFDILFSPPPPSTNSAIGSGSRCTSDFFETINSRCMVIDTPEGKLHTCDLDCPEIH